MSRQTQRLNSPKPNQILIQGFNLRQRQSSSKHKHKKNQKNHKEISQFVIPSKKSKQKDQPSELIKEIRKTFQDKINQLTKKYFKQNNGQNQFSSIQHIQTSHIQADFQFNEGSLNKRNKFSTGKQQKQQQHTLGYGSILRIYEDGKSQQRLLSKKLQSIGRIYEQQMSLLTQKFQSIISDIELIQSRTLYFLQQEKQKHLVQCQIQEQIYDFILTLKKVKKNYIRRQNSKQERRQEHVCRFSSEGELMKVLILNERGSQLMRRVQKIEEDLQDKYARVDKSVSIIVDLMSQFKTGELLLTNELYVQQQQPIEQNKEQLHDVNFENSHLRNITNNEQKKIEQIIRTVQQIQPKVQNYDDKLIERQVQISDDALINIVLKENEQVMEGLLVREGSQQQQGGLVSGEIGNVIDGGEPVTMRVPEENVGIQQQHCVVQVEINEQQLHVQQHQIAAQTIPASQQQPNDSPVRQQQINTFSQQKRDSPQNSPNPRPEVEQNATSGNQNNTNQKQTLIDHSSGRDSVVEQEPIYQNSSNHGVVLSAHIRSFNQLQPEERRLSQFTHQLAQSTPIKETPLQASPIHLLSSKRSIKDLSSILKTNIHHINFNQTQRRTNNLIPQPSSKPAHPMLAVNQTLNLQNPDKNHPKHNPYSGFFKSLQKITNKITNTQNEQYPINAFQFQLQTHHQIHQEATFRNYKSGQQLPLYQLQLKDQTKNLNQSKDLSLNSNIPLAQNPYTINLRHDYPEQRQFNRQMSMNELSSSRNNAKNICFGKLREQKLKFQKIKTSNYLIMN